MHRSNRNRYIHAAADDLDVRGAAFVV